MDIAGSVASSMALGMVKDTLRQISGIRIDRPTSYNFIVEIEGIGMFDGALGTGGFQKCTPPTHRLNEYKIKQSNQKEITRLYTSTQTGLITLEKGVLWNSDLKSWLHQARTWSKGDLDYRKTITIIQLIALPAFGQGTNKVNGIASNILSGQKVEMKREVYEKCTPVDYTPKPFSAMKDGLAIEKIVIRPGELVSYTNYSDNVSAMLDAFTDSSGAGI